MRYVAHKCWFKLWPCLKYIQEKSMVKNTVINAMPYHRTIDRNNKYNAPHNNNLPKCVYRNITVQKIIILKHWNGYWVCNWLDNNEQVMTKILLRTGICFILLHFSCSIYSHSRTKFIIPSRLHQSYYLMQPHNSIPKSWPYTCHNGNIISLRTWILKSTQLHPER